MMLHRGGGGLGLTLCPFLVPCTKCIQNVNVNVNEDALCELVRFYSPKGMAKNWVYLPALAGLQMVLTQYGLLVPS